jgi:dihydroorotate dehydrogenase
MGLDFPNRIGLAAGFDKDAKMMDVFAALGFGFIEIGTLTPRPQSGNEKPRLFRLPKDASLINRMGFNNEGVDAAVERLKKRPKGIIIGGNIGKNKTTPNEKAHEDYAYCFEKLFPYVDYFVVNVSSPNTPGLRDLQEKEPLLKLLLKLQELNHAKDISKPILLKIAPDLSPSQLDDVLEIVEKSEIQGLIATNTTVSRSGLTTSASEIERIGNGGLSGQALTKKSTALISYLKANARNPDMLIIGVGGVHNPETAQEKHQVGAQLIQIYTGLIYEGPSLPARLAKALAN